MLDEDPTGLVEVRTSLIKVGSQGRRSIFRPGWTCAPDSWWCSKRNAIGEHARISNVWRPQDDLSPKPQDGRGKHGRNKRIEIL